MDYHGESSLFITRLGILIHAWNVQDSRGEKEDTSRKAESDEIKG